MNASDRDEFKTELAKLCAGFGVPLTKVREEAFWSGLARMSLGQFRRCVASALADGNTDSEQPTTRMIWRIHRGTALDAAKPQVAEEPDHLAYFANRLLLLHITHRGSLGSPAKFVPGYGMVDCRASPELQDCLEFKRDLVTEWLPYIRDRDELATPAEFLRRWIIGLRRVSRLEQREHQALQAFADDPRSFAPFPAHMGRELLPVQRKFA